MVSIFFYTMLFGTLKTTSGITAARRIRYMLKWHTADYSHYLFTFY